MKQQSYINTIKKYRWSSIFIKYLKSFVLAICIPSVICGSLIFVSYKHQLNEKMRDEIQLTSKSISQDFEDLISNINVAYSKIVSNSYVLSFLYRDTYTPSRYVINTDEIYSLLSNFTFSSAFIDSIYLYNQKQNYVFSTQSSSFFESFYDTDWLGLIKESGKEYLIVSRNVPAKKMKYLSFILKYSEFSDIPAYIVFNIDYQKYMNALENSNKNLSGLTICDTDGNILLSDKVYANDNSNYEKSNSDYHEVICSGYSISFAVSNEMYDIKLKSYIVIFIFILLMLISVSVFIAYFISAQFYKMTYDIIEMLQPTESDEKTKNDGKINNEYNYIAQNIYHLKADNRELEAKLSNNIAALKKLQLNILHEQISPHFIYNTLNLISLIDVMEHDGDGKISIIINLLSDILHSVMDSSKYINTFDEELNNVDKYCKIQMIKYDNIFDFEYDIENETRKFKVVKFILQPIVENSITHSILKKTDGKGIIQIKSYTENDFLYITVSDNGAGFDSETLQNINNSLKTDTIIPSNHIGLINVNSRIKLIFGSEYGLSIASEYGKTSVTYTLPIIV